RKLSLASLYLDGYDYNNQTFSHKVFEEKSDKKTENVVNVEAMLQTPNSMKPKGECKDILVQIKTEVNKAQKLFGNYSHKVQQQLVDNKVVDSLWERSDPLILDRTRLMHKHIFINFPFDPDESIPPSITFKSMDIHLDISH
ncbi:hypothetical protein H5410_061551, partial [Solanum commersonii]